MVDSGAVAAATEQHAFEAQSPSRHIERMQRHREENGELGIALSELWVGIAGQQKGYGCVDVGFACHDTTYTVDFAVHTLEVRHEAANGELNGEVPNGLPAGENGQALAIADHFVASIRDYEHKNHYKFLGAAISQEVVRLSPQTPARLWAELDIAPIVIRQEDGGSMESGMKVDAVKSMDELADAMARKALGFFGPSKQPRVQVGFNNKVKVDLDGRAVLTTLEQYKNGQAQKKFAFFSATPQGGGVALMRHAQIRSFRLLGVDASWWVPKPKPEVFGFTKTNHNILQGVADPKERLTNEQQLLIRDWIHSNAERFWTRDGGPLAPRSKGGVDVVIIDDPQTPDLISIAKKQDPKRPVIFRSHIQIRSDLAEKLGTPTVGVWDWLWKNVQHTDVFISHPVKAFVPHTVRKRALGYMPATTDWLDSLNKPLSDFDTAYYLHELNTECTRQSIPKLAYPKRTISSRSRASTHRKLVVAGHYSVDDPDGVAVLDQTLGLLETKYSDIRESVIAMRLGPTDQLLNALMSEARVGLQLSTREGFEVKVSEGLRKGVPMIVSKAGGIPLQVQDGKSGFLVEVGDMKAVAKYLDLLFSDEER